MKRLFPVFFALMAASALFVSGCGSSANIVTPPPAQAQAGANRVIVEQLARPGVAEALLLDNSNLAIYNSVGPDFIFRALTNPGGPEAAAAAPVLTEATASLTLFSSLAPGATPGQLAAAFLPDVMRINTANNVPLGTAAYSFQLNATGSPVSGRKLLDDVIDISLTVLTNGALTTDNTPYYRPATGAGSTNAAIGHQNLNGQATQFGPATFPFLAPPN